MGVIVGGKVGGKIGGTVGGKPGGKTGGKIGIATVGDASFLLIEDIYAKVKVAVDNAPLVTSVAGNARKITLDCSTLSFLLGAVSSGFSQFCAKKSKKKGKGKGKGGGKGKKGGK